MGYGWDYFDSWTRQWIVNGWLPRGGSLVELGAQCYHGDAATTRRLAADLLVFLGIDERRAASFVATIERGGYSGDFYKFAGFTYLSLDVNALPHSAVFDLSCHEVPECWRGAFDFANNEGTIEHIANPTNGFRCAHDLVRAGGVIRHSMPQTGWPTHGLFNITPKLYVALAQANDYETLYFWPEMNRYANDSRELNVTLAQARTQSPNVDAHLRVDPVAGRFLTGGAPWTEIDTWTHIAFRKTVDRSFRVPVDCIGDDDDVATMLRDNYTRSVRQGALEWVHPSALQIPTLLERGDFAAAAAACAEVLDLCPRDHQVLRAAARVEIELGHKKEAMDLLKKAIALSPTTAEYGRALHELAEAL